MIEILEGEPQQVYAIFKDDHGKRPRIYEGEIVEELRKSFCVRFKGVSGRWTFSDKAMGATVFLLRKAAEEKLKELEEGNVREIREF